MEKLAIKIDADTLARIDALGDRDEFLRDAIDDRLRRLSAPTIVAGGGTVAASLPVPDA